MISLRVLGIVQAGFATPAEENLLDSITLDTYMIRNPDQSFMLRVSGDSMKDAGIHPGDLVIVERTTEARVGSIVIAEVDGAWTMKYLRSKDGRQYLEAANSEFEPIIPKEGLRITAIVKGVVRRYD